MKKKFLKDDITAIEYKVERLDSVETGFEIDAYEEYDLYLKNVLEKDETNLNLVSIEETIKAFEEDVR